MKGFTLLSVYICRGGFRGTSSRAQFNLGTGMDAETDKDYMAVHSVNIPSTEIPAGLLVISLHSRLIRGHGDALFGSTLTYLRRCCVASQ
jgi:hypothetical protein